METTLRPKPENIAHALGLQLKAVRQAAGKNQTELSKDLRLSNGLASKFESGARVPREEIFAAWMTECEVRGQLLYALECMWWLARKHDDPGVALTIPWFDAEAQAHTLRYWSPMLMPGLGQTRKYAQAVFTAWRHDPDTVKKLTEHRLARRSILDRQDGPDVTIVLWEPVLYTPIGTPEDMHEQLTKLVELSDHPRVHLHVLRSDIGAHMGMSGSITLATTDASEVLLNEGYPEAVVTADPAQVRAASAAFNSIRSDALNRAESRSILVEAAETWSKGSTGGSPATATEPPAANA